MFKTLKKKLIYENKWIRLFEDDIVLPNGEPGIYAYHERVDPGSMIIPVMNDGKIVVLKEWRYPIQQWTYCFPFGGRNAGEDALETAKRELQEETGYTAATWTALGHIYIDPGSNTQMTPVFLARDLTPGIATLEISEVHEVCTFTITEIKHMIGSGQITNGWFLAGFAQSQYTYNFWRMKKIFRSKTDRMVAGICGGLGVYCTIDATIIRLALILLAVLTGGVPVIVGYIVCAIIVPEETTSDESKNT